MRILISLLFLTIATCNAYANDVVSYILSQDRYVLVVSESHLRRLFIQLRSHEDDRLLDEVVLISRYMEPAYKEADVINIEGETEPNEKELVVETRGGGTGIATTTLDIFAFIEDRIVNIGSFVIDHYLTARPLKNYTEKIKGEIRFIATNKLEYEFKKEIEENGKRSVIKRIEKYVFDAKLKKLVKEAPNVRPEEGVR